MQAGLSRWRRDYASARCRLAILPLIRRWLETPEVVRWWGDPDEQYALVSGDLDHPAMDQFIVAIDGHPFGYIQCYALEHLELRVSVPQPEGTRGIDQFIGEPAMIGRGHGSGFIRQFADDCWHPACRASSPIPIRTMRRAVRAYAKAGFQTSASSIRPTARPC